MCFYLLAQPFFWYGQQTARAQVYFYCMVAHLDMPPRACSLEEEPIPFPCISEGKILRQLFCDVLHLDTGRVFVIGVPTGDMNSHWREQLGFM